MIDRSVIKEILSAVDIVQLVGEYVQLKRAGHSLVGLCPFHNEKTPSFHVTADKGMFYCFGCGTGGSAVDFLMKIEGLSFPEAIEQLANRVGIQIRQSDDRDARPQKKRRDAMLEIMAKTQDFFEAQFCSSAGQDARDYAQKRGITPNMREAFHIGYAGAVWEELPGFLKSQHLDLSIARDLGLLGERESGGFYGKFRERLMFPVHDERGRVIAFSGRNLSAAETAKYINSPESDLYTKGEHLFGLDLAKQHIRREKTAILVEGNVDVVMMHCHGFCHTVASLGTALTPSQAKLLSRYADRVIVLYDGDNAGRKAAMRALGILLKYPLETSIAPLPQGEDPDSFCKAFGHAGMADLLQTAEPLSMWCVKKQCEAILAVPLELRKHAIGELGSLLKLFDEPLVIRHFLEESARLLSMDPGRLATDLSLNYSFQNTPTKGNFRESLQTVPSNRQQSAHHSIESILLRILLDSPPKLTEFMESGGLELIENVEFSRLLEAVFKLQSEGFTENTEILNALEENTLRQIYNETLCMDLDVDEIHIEDWYRGAIAKLTENWACREIVRVGYELQLAISQGNQEETNELVRRYSDLQQLRIQKRDERKVNWQLERANDVSG